MADDHAAVGAWFLGPRAENATQLTKFFNQALTDQASARKHLYDGDPVSITAEMQENPKFKEQIEKLGVMFTGLSSLLAVHSVPFWSPRYNGHMNMETTFPSVIGYILTVLYNPNNVALEASPLTTLLEECVGEQLCLMLGYHISEDNRRNPLMSIVPVKQPEPADPPPDAWGHVTCDGSVANLEALWAARNLKFYSFTLRVAIKSDEGPLRFLQTEAQPFEIQLCTGIKKAFLECSDWELLNLSVSTVLGIPDQLYNQYGISQTYLQNALKDSLVQSEGLRTMMQSLDVSNPPQVFVGATRHYSWDKAAAVLGIGNGNVQAVPVDDAARMDTKQLDQLLAECIAPTDECKRTLVYQVVVIMGSTEQGAIDPLVEVLALRDKYEQKGLSFVVHCDAAWGGYFASMIRRPSEDFKGAPPASFVPENTLSEYVTKQVLAFGQSDSITIDPHKSGYAPYPTGGLCYRNGRMRYLVTWTSPIVFHEGDQAENIGVYGIEGSKPGAAAVGAYLSHEVIGLHKDGYGRLLGQAMFTCNKLYSIWATMSIKEDSPLIVVPFNLLPSERLNPPDPEKVKEEKEFIWERIVNASNSELINDEKAWALFQELGGDVMINAFACNFKVDGETNNNIAEANYLNNRLFQRTSVSKEADSIGERKMFLTSTTLSQKSYGDCLTKFKKRLGVVGDDDLFVLVNVTMSPWPTVDGFINKITDEFKAMAIKETEPCVMRNKITLDLHGFIMQGTDKLCLVHLPMFYMANHRYQVIITGNLDSITMKKYQGARAQHPDKFFVLGNHNKDTLQAITMEGASFQADIFMGLPFLDPHETIAENVKLSDVHVIIKKSMVTRDLLPDYPMQMPFYLYGTKQQKHIDHALLHAPDQQLNSDQVTLTTDEEVSEQDLNNGIVAVFSTVYERSMQPMQRSSEKEVDHSSFKVPGFDFSAGNTFRVTIFKSLDKNGNCQVPITKGTVKLGASVYADDFEINKDGGAHAEKEETKHHFFDGIVRGPIESIPALADEYPVTGGTIESANRRRGRVMKGWMDQLGRALTEGGQSSACGAGRDLGPVRAGSNL